MVITGKPHRIFEHCEVCSTNSRWRYDIYERQHFMNTSLYREACSTISLGKYDMYDKQHFMNTSLYCEVCSNNFRGRYEVTCRKDNTSWTRHFTVCSSPDEVKPKTIKLIFAASPLTTQQLGERAKTGWLGIRIMCPNGATCLSAECCFSELAL